MQIVSRYIQRRQRHQMGDLVRDSLQAVAAQVQHLQPCAGDGPQRRHVGVLQVAVVEVELPEGFVRLVLHLRPWPDQLQQLRRGVGDALDVRVRVRVKVRVRVRVRVRIMM